MKVLSVYLFLAFILFFGTGNFSYAQVVQEKVYTKWLDCGRLKVPVSDSPDFKEGDIELYRSGFGHLVFVEQGESIYCRDIGLAWELDGFIYGMESTGIGRPVLLFKVSAEDKERYFDVRNKKEVYRTSGPGEGLIVADEPLPDSGKLLGISQAWEGNDSKITEKEYHRITSKDEWQKLWQRHSPGDEALPAVDFSKDMIIAVFLGKTVNTGGITAQVEEIGGVLRFQFDGRGYQTLGKWDKVTPFGIFVIPRSDMKVILEENVQNLIGGPARWKTQATFDEL
jgi:hypothetical protein